MAVLTPHTHPELGKPAPAPTDSSVNGNTQPSQPQRGPLPFSVLDDGLPPLLPGREIDSRSHLCIPEVTPVPGSHLEDDPDLVI